MLTASIYRLRSSEPYQRAEIKLINELTARLGPACELAIRLGLRSIQSISDAFSNAGHPIAATDATGRVIYMNARFEQLLGPDLTVRDGRLASADVDADRTLAAALKRATDDGGSLECQLPAVVLPRREGRPLVARIAPVVGRANDLLARESAIVMLTDLDADDVGPELTVLRGVFGLTPAEARLAAQIAAGKSLADIAQVERITRETVRGRLKSVFEKTGTSRQPDLAILLAKLPARSQ